MSNTTATPTATITLAAIERGYRRPGPWASTYEVNLQTLAVSVAQRGNAEMDDLPTAAAAVEATMTAALAEEAAHSGPRSINDFWNEQIYRLTSQARAAVTELATDLLEAHREGRFGDPATDLYEMFDGQR